MLKAVSSGGNSGGGGAGVTSLNGETGALTITSSGATVVITTPTGNTINLEASGGSAVAFNAITSGTNTAAAMVVGSGSTLGTSGTGTITATSVPGTGITGNTLASGVVISSLTQVGTIATGTWNGSIITVPFGGTGTSSLTAHAVLLGEGTASVGFATIGTAGRLLIDQGAGADPAFEVMTGDVALTSGGTATIQANAVTTSKINNSAVTYAKIQNETASTLLGNPTGSPAAPSEITLGTNLSFSGSVLNATGGGSSAFDAITSGTNTTATMVVGSGATLSTSGSGTIAATSAPAAGLTGNTLASGVVNSSLTQVGTITTGTWNGSIITVPFGGTGTSSLTAHAVLLGEGTATVGFATIGTSGRLLIDQGAGADPAFEVVSGDIGITHTGLTTISAIQGTTVSGTTGSGNVVFSSAPTMTNPVVGTQSAADNSTKAASTAYVTSAISTAISGVDPAIAVQAATTQASDTSGLTYNNGVSGVGATFTGSNNTAVVIDGFTFTAINQRLLVKNDTQSPSGAFNGIYYVTQIQSVGVPPIFTRALDYNQPSNINNTGAIPVVNGTVNGSTTWVLTSAVATVGTDPLTYTQFSLNPTTIQTTTLANGSVWIGNSSNIATAHALSSDVTITNTGVATIANNAVTTAKINNSAVTYAKIQNEAATSILGNPTGSPAAPSEITLDATLGFSGTTLKATTATSSQLGVVKPDNSTITISGGILTATTGGGGSVTSVTASGGLTASPNPIVGSGTISIADSTANTLAGYDNSGVFADVTIGSNLTLSGGVLSATGGGGGTNLGLVYAIASGNLIM
jgi:hypothetical protein